MTRINDAEGVDFLRPYIGLVGKITPILEKTGQDVLALGRAEALSDRTPEHDRIRGVSPAKRPCVRSSGSSRVA